LSLSAAVPSDTSIIAPNRNISRLLFVTDRARLVENIGEKEALLALESIKAL
jgi:hypothetical protein